MPIQDKTDPGPERPAPGGHRPFSGGRLPELVVTFKLTNAPTAVSLLCNSEAKFRFPSPGHVVSPLPPAVRVVLPLFAFKFYEHESKLHEL